MKVILLQNVKKIGKKGDIKDVSDGYARNFLLPKKLAEIGTPTAIKNAEVAIAKQVMVNQAELERTESLAEQLDGREIIITVKAKAGKLFGSVSSKTITAALKDEHLEISENMVKLTNPIKETGEYQTRIELPHGIEATINVIVEGTN